MVLKAYEVMVAIDTPFDRVRVSKASAGIIQERGPQVHENEKLNSQVMMMNPQWAPVLLTSGGNLANRIQAMMNVTQLPRLPLMRLRRRPKWSMNSMHRNWPTRAMIELMAW